MGTHILAWIGPMTHLARLPLYREWPTIPQVFVKGEFVGGSDIMMSMHQEGELEEVLKKD